MEATKCTGVTTILERDGEGLENSILTQNSIGMLAERAEETCESNDNHFTNYPDGEEHDGTVYDDPGSYEKPGEEGEIEHDNADGYDGYNEDEEIAYDETEACQYSHEHDEATESEEEYETAENINEEDRAIQPGTAAFHDSSGHEADWSGESDQVSSMADWSSPASASESSYMYEECEYFLSSPPDVRYAFLRHIINVFEASFHRLGHHLFGEELKSEEWRVKILTDKGVGRLAKLSWHKVHAVEVKDWIKFLERVRDEKLLSENALADPGAFSPPNLSPAFKILKMANYIRNTTFHREEPVIESQLRTALQIPRVLKDGKRTEQLEMIYEVIVNNPTLDAPSSEWVRKILFPSQLESGTCLEVATRVLGILEEGSFYFAQREDSGILAQRLWTEPEDGEMQIYARHWRNAPGKYWDLEKRMKPEECANLDGQFFLHQHLREEIMSDATNLRNSVSHRDPPNERGVCYNVWSSILCFILMGDRIRAIEVESLVEAFLTKTSQTEALVRLYNASWNDEPARRQAIVEVCRREGIGADRLDSPERKLFPVSSGPGSDIGTRWPEISKSAKAKWSLTEDEKFSLWHSAVHRFVFCDSMHETLMKERPVEWVES